MVAVSTKLLLVFMEISIFASLFTPPGLSAPPAPLRASVSLSNGQQQQGSAHASGSSNTTGHRSGSLHAPFGLHTRPEPNTLIRTNQQHDSAQASGSNNPSNNLSGRQGPKSLGGTRQSSSHSQQQGSTDVMVAMPCAGIAGASANSLRAESLMAKRSTRASKFCTAKRAFKRAQRRALEHGSTMYRGRICTAASLGCHSLHVQDTSFSSAATRTVQHFSRQPRSSQRTPGMPRARTVSSMSDRIHGSRLRVVSFNLGGICTSTYDVMMQWLQHEGKNYDVVMLQETHYGLGREPTCYQVPGWTVCSSPDPSTRFAGVAVLVSARLSAGADVQYHHVVQGRLLHVRVPIGVGRQARSLDIVCCYQWSWDPDPSKHRLAHRLEFWHKLTCLVQSLPKRNCHCVAGDFNCSLRPIPQRVGPGLCASGTTHPDTGEFCQFISASDLCALNTWTASRTAHTYTMPGTQPKRSHIDFVLVNRACVDGLGKSSKPDFKICFSPWRGGAKHHAVTANIKACYRLAPSHRRPDTGFARESFRLAARAQNSAFQAFRQDLAERVLSTQVAQPADLNTAVLDCCVRHFPNRPEQSLPRPWQCTDIQITVKDMWATHHSYRTALAAFHRSMPRDLLRLAFQVFRCHVQFSRAQRTLRKRGSLKRRQLFLQDLDTAEQAANQGDIHLLYKQIRRLAPKTKHERIQLRQADGKMMSQQAEFDTIKGYFATVFTRDRPGTLARPRTDAYVPSLHRIECALRQSRSGRAVPSGCVPPEIWHHCADVLSG